MHEIKGHLPDQEISQLRKLTMIWIFNCNIIVNRINCHIKYIKPFTGNQYSILFVWQRTVTVTLRKATSPTFYNSPRCLPPQNSFSIYLIFFVAAHHSKGHCLLWTETLHHGSVYRRELHKVYERKQIQNTPQCPGILLGASSA